MEVLGNYKISFSGPGVDKFAILLTNDRMNGTEIKNGSVIKIKSTSALLLKAKKMEEKGYDITFVLKKVK